MDLNGAFLSYGSLFGANVEAGGDIDLSNAHMFRMDASEIEMTAADEIKAPPPSRPCPPAYLLPS